MIYKNDELVLSDLKNGDIINIQNTDLKLVSLNGIDSGKGANSSVFILRDPDGEEDDRIIKFCNTPSHWHNSKGIKRFEREIRAFELARKNKLKKVISYYGHGLYEVEKTKYRYIILEKGECDLEQFMLKNKFAFSINQKLNFCHNILIGLKELHAVGIYHRDIKHDNIFVINNNEMKIGDLGLVKFRSQDLGIDEPNGKVGPYAWLSPEATNKIFTYKRDIPFKYDCEINDMSDVFQLGKLFWYIFQGNLPLGQIRSSDYNIADSNLFDIVFSMLEHNQKRRPTVVNLEKSLAPLLVKYGV